jgi:hypothetical protein
VIQCRGFNDKNHYDRTTPCDQDTLRKAVKDVEAERWMDWFNGPVQEVFQRKKAHRERCYKLVSLLHLRGDCFVYAAMKVVPGNAHECPVLYELVEQFVRQLGPGILKRLILDRGFIDGKNISRCKTEWGIDVLIPIKKQMDIWTDAWALGQRAAWRTLTRPKPEPKKIPENRPEAIVRRESKRQKTLAKLKAQEPPPDPAKVLKRTEVCPMEGFNSWSECAVPLHVVLIRETYGDGHQDQWALLSTASVRDPVRTIEEYGLRTASEERHRILKCFHDLSDFSMAIGPTQTRTALKLLKTVL